VWAGKKEPTSFEVPTVSLHVHERIDPRTIIEAVRKRNGVRSSPPRDISSKPAKKIHRSVKPSISTATPTA
jgi:hypothetical protein